MSNSKKIVSLVIYLFSFVILMFVTFPQFSEIQENKEIERSKIEELTKVDNELKELNKINSIQKSENTIKRFLQEYNEADIFKYINDYIEESNRSSNNLVLKFGSINFEKEKKSEFGFKEVNITLKMQFIKNSTTLRNFLDYLISPINKYSFYITDFSFPIESSGPYKGLTINLKMFIK